MRENDDKKMRAKQAKRPKKNTIKDRWRPSSYHTGKSTRNMKKRR